MKSQIRIRKEKKFTERKESDLLLFPRKVDDLMKKEMFRDWQRKKDMSVFRAVRDSVENLRNEISQGIKRESVSMKRKK